MSHTAFPFTFSYIRNEFEKVLAAGYRVVTCAEYCALKQSGLPDLLLVNRIDIDLSVKKTEQLVDIFNGLGIKGTFFLRLHAPEYNPMSFENYRILKKLVESGHELAYHSEVMDEAAVWDEDPATCMRRDIALINTLFAIQIKGTASHGGFSPLNNLDFWKRHTPQEFGLLYEGYDTQPAFNLFQESLYVSDSNWTFWKCYDQGKLREGDRRSLSEHVLDKPRLIYSLIHPDTYYHRHPHETD